METPKTILSVREKEGLFPNVSQTSQDQQQKAEAPGRLKILQSLPDRGIVKGQGESDFDNFLAGSFDGIRSKPNINPATDPNKRVIKTHESAARVKKHRQHLARVGQPDVWGYFAIEILIGPKKVADAKETISAFVHSLSVKHNRHMPSHIPKIKSELNTPVSFRKPSSTWVFRYIEHDVTETRGPTINDPIAVLLISPTLTEGYNLPAWERNIQNTWHFLTENYDVHRKADWGTDVTIMPAAGFHFHEIKLLAQAFMHFRSPLDLYLHDIQTQRGPGGRGGQEIRVSNAGGHSLSGTQGTRSFLTTDWNTIPLLRDKTPAQAVAAIEATTEWDEFSRIFVLAAWLIDYEGNETASELYIANLAAVVKPEHGLLWAHFFISFARGVMARGTMKRLVEIPPTPLGLQFLLTGRGLPEGASLSLPVRPSGKVRGGETKGRPRSGAAASSGHG